MKIKTVGSTIDGQAPIETIGANEVTPEDGNNYLLVKTYKANLLEGLVLEPRNVVRMIVNLFAVEEGVFVSPASCSSA